MNLKVAIIDDLQIDADNLKTLINRWAKENEHTLDITYFDSPKKALTAYEKNASCFDIMFVDCMMPDMQGDAFIRELTANGASILFILMSKEHSYMKVGYRVEAFDFLCKPFATADVFDTLYRIANKIQSIKEESYIFYTDKTTYKVAFKDILYINVERNYAKILTAKSSYTFRKTVKDLLCEFPSNFIQSKSNTIINIAKVTAFSKTAVTFGDSGYTAPISATYFEDVYNAFYKYN